MKKIILLLSLFVAALGANAQRSIVFNELVPDPGNNDAEYFELYNTTSLPVNVDCYTVVAYDFLNDGAWVYNLPNKTITPFGFLLFASEKPMSYKCGTFDTSTLVMSNWNVADASSKLTYYDRVGNALVNPVDGFTTNLIPIAGGNSAAMAIMLFDETGELINGFFTNNGTTIPVEVTTLASLNYTITAPANACGGSNINLNFAGISAPEAEVLSVNQAVGNNNNYYRKRDGFCGQWDKGSVCNGANNAFSPASKNSGLPPIVESDLVITSALQLACGSPNTNWNISIAISDATLLPGYYRVYADMNLSQTLTPGDVLVAEGPISTVNPVVLTNLPVPTGRPVIIQVSTVSGCIVVTRFFSTQCLPLPVNFKSFTATRVNSNNVMLKWETSMEQNNSGYAVERNVNGTWEQIGWVASLAPGGNSDAPLSYSYIDQNSIKGVTQYRLRQVDFDAKAKYSEVRAVRGEGQLGKTIIYPNPTNDGKVNIVFEGATGNRDISVADLSGRIVKQYRGITNNNLTIDNLQAGMYMVRIVATETGEQIVEKIVVNKR